MVAIPTVKVVPLTQDHKTVCRYELVMCANTDCKQVVMRGDMETL